MPYTKGLASDFDNLIAQVVSWATDATIHGSDAWEVMRSEPWPRGTILKAKGLQEEDHFYIGLLALDLEVGKSYKNWLFTDENVGKYMVWAPGPNGLNFPDGAFTFNPITGTVTVFPDKYDHSAGSQKYTISNPEIVHRSCKALVFGVFKQYAPELNWNEQPGSLEFGDIGLKPLRVSIGTTTGSIGIRPPIYPGIGYPGFGMDYDEPESGFFHFWATKDASRITIVIQNGEQWDMGHAGLLVPYHSRMQYPFPAVMAGSCTGLTYVGGMDTLSGGQQAPGIHAWVDYTYSNWMLTRSMPPFATSLVDWETGTSQVCLCRPDGTWRYFIDWVQSMSAKLNDDKYTYSFKVEAPTRPTQIKHYIKPTCTSLSGSLGVYGATDTYKIEPLELVQDESMSKNIYGRLWRMFWPSRKVRAYGEATINGKLHLVLPNCWEDRHWYITGNSGISDPDTLLRMQNQIDDNSHQMNFLIRLED